MSQVRIGFIGAGGIASRHLGDLLGFDDVRVIALSDPVLERAESQAARCDANAYREYAEMLEREELDAVYICVPPFAHGEPEQIVVERGLPFFVEKPLAIDYGTAEAIARQVQSKNLVTAVGYHWRYLDTTERAQELLSANPARLVAGYWIDKTPPPGWWIKRELMGEQMVEQTTHIFDLARYLVGDVTRVYAAGESVARPDFPDADIWEVSVATLHFASGALGTMSSTCILNWPHRIGLHLFAPELAIELTEWEMIVDVGRGRPEQKPTVDPFVLEDRDFIDAVQGKPNRIRSPYTEALKTHQVTTAAVRSAREGCIVDIELHSNPVRA